MRRRPVNMSSPTRTMSPAKLAILLFSICCYVSGRCFAALLPDESSLRFVSSDHLVLAETCCQVGQVIHVIQVNSSESSHEPFATRYHIEEVILAGSSSLISESEDLLLDPRTGFLSLLRPLDFEKTSGYKLNVSASIYPAHHVHGHESSSRQSLVDPASAGNSQATFLPPPSRIMYQTLTIHILNRNDESPVIKGHDRNGHGDANTRHSNSDSNYHYSVQVSEDIEPSSLILHVQAYDPDGDVVTFMFPDGHPCSSIFDLNPSTGELRTRVALDRESAASHDLPIYVFDEDHEHMTLARVLITVSDVNEYSPEFSVKSHWIRIPEDIPTGSTIYRLLAYDRDLWPPPPPSDTQQTVPALKYSFADTSGNSAGDSSNDGLFKLDPLSGHITTTRPLDREQQPLYDFVVEVTDGYYTTSCNLTIELLDVNDNAPVFDRKVYAAVLDVPEGSDLKEKEIVTVRASDADPEDKIYYSLNSSSLVKSDSLFFRLNSTSGVITADIAALVQSQRFRNKNPSESMSSTFSFSVIAMDVGSSYKVHSTSADVRVTFTHSLSPRPPKLKQYPLIVELDGQKSDFKVGAHMGSIEFASLGTASRVNIAVKDADSDYRCSDYLTIDSWTGGVSVRRSLQTDLLECFLDVSGTEGGSPVTSSLLQIFLKKGMSPELKARKANALAMQVDILESQEVNSKIVDLVIGSKMPALSSGRYQFAIAYSSIAASTYLTLDSSSGVIYLKKQLDAEMLPPNIEIVAVATDKSNPFDSPIYFNIDLSLINVNDESPTFNQDHFMAFIEEGRNRGSVVTPTFALDRDSLRQLFEFQEEDKASSGTSMERPWIQYTISDGNIDEAFSIDANSGVVRTNMVLDREIRSHYRLTVSAIDLNHSVGPGRSPQAISASAILDIYVMDIDDNLPVFPPHHEVRVRESSQVGSVLMTLTANDVDLFPAITYRKQSTINGPPVPFDIDMFSGKMILLEPLTGQANFAMKILASDSLHTIETEVKIQVGDPLAHPPTLENQFQFVQVDANSNRCLMSGAVNCQVARVQSINPFKRPQSAPVQVMYRMASDPSGSFYVDSTTGVLFNNRSLKLRSNKLFSVSVMAGYSLNGDRYLNGLRSRSHIMINILRSPSHPDHESRILPHSKHAFDGNTINDIASYHEQFLKTNSLNETDLINPLDIALVNDPKSDFDKKACRKPWYSRRETIVWSIITLIGILLIPVAMFLYRRRHQLSALKDVKKIDWNDLHFLDRRSNSGSGSGSSSATGNEMNVPVAVSDNMAPQIITDQHMISTTIYPPPGAKNNMTHNMINGDHKISNDRIGNPLQGVHMTTSNHYQWDCLYNPPPFRSWMPRTANHVQTCSPVYPTHVSPVISPMHPPVPMARESLSRGMINRTPSEYEFRPIELPPES